MKNDDLLKLGHKIRLERMRKGISQEDFAELAGISRRCISTLECGSTDPKYTTLLQVANALNLEISKLLDFRL